ncbi:hypothetical protein BDA99DRAFT_531247 [Phascolomyces articulosus]|uniref:Uncharacterized protein n=1 Tax=Phascolomyces articulosus TaxID=60185 RepID=A0AAD5KRD8_9FUNG|nr:hypothetical protein BDA99DRAFT_531247 [Phascolomyces articulosus]
MMRLIQLASLATVMLQLGTFVQANPLFDGTHNNDGSPTDICSTFRVTYPMEEGLSFADNSRHLISWQAPKGIQQVNVTIVNPEQKTVAMVNVFNASKGVSGEIPISLNGQDTGDFHFHLAAIGGPACQADSATFKITREDDEDDDEKKQEKETDQKKDHKNDDSKDWSHALQQLDDYVKEDDKKDEGEHKNKWFTNYDERTHLNDHLNQELDQLFSKSGKETQHDDVTEWLAVELDVEPEPKHEDTAENMFDHTNDGTFSDEEYDPAHVDAEGFQAEEHDDDAKVEYVMDFTNVGQWQEEQINPDDVEGSYEHQNGEWVEDIKKFDHTNVGQWEEQEVSYEEHTSGQHDNVVEWQAQEIEAHFDGDWHENVASGDWIEEQAQQEVHPNLASGEWFEDSPESHDDADAWITEEVDEHGASTQHTDEVKAAPLPSDTEFHSDEVAVGSDWEDESAVTEDIPDHTDAAPFIEEEIQALAQQSVHSDASEGWYEEPTHSDDASPSSGRVGTGRMPAVDSTHDNDGTIPVIPAEALIAKW